MHGYIRTRSGKLFCLDGQNTIDIADIASHLAAIRRYVGAIPYHYSVAQHSVLLYAYFRRNDYDPVVVAQALLHDAAEAYLADIPGPFKDQFPDYVRAEEAVTKTIFDALGVEYPPRPIVHIFDKQLGREEMYCLTDWPEGADMGITGPYGIVPWDESYAESQFLKAYSYAMKALKEKAA